MPVVGSPRPSVHLHTAGARVCSVALPLASRCRRGRSAVDTFDRSAVCQARPRKTTSAAVDSDDDQALQTKALNEAVKVLTGKYGKGTVQKLSDKSSTVKTIRTGCLPLDIALGGGYPEGRIVEIFGPESSGKTTLAIHAIAEVQKAGGKALFIDAEHAFDKSYAERCGVNVDDLYFSQPDCGEEALDIADEFARAGVNLICIDSVSALTPRSEIQSDIGVSQVGSQARLMSTALRKIPANLGKHKATLLFINQIRLKVGQIYGNPETTSGGMALKYYASQRLEVRVVQRLDGNPPIGNRVRVKVVKNKVAPPHTSAEFDILFGSGINAIGCLLDAAESSGVVTRNGSYYYFADERLGQGKDAVSQRLSADEDLHQRLEQALQAARVGSADSNFTPTSTFEDEQLDAFNKDDPADG